MPRAVLCALACLACAACNVSFDDESRVEDLRVLAVVADPPEVLLDAIPVPAAPACRAARVPDALPTVKVTPLIVDPAGAGRVLRFRAVTCPNIPDGGGGPGGPGGARQTVSRRRCPRDGSELLGERTGLPESFAFDFTPAASLALAAFQADPAGVLFGFPIVLELQVATLEGTEEVTVLKRVIYTPKLRDEQKPNQNPKVMAVRAYTARGDEKQEFLPDAPLSVPLGRTLLVEPEFLDGEAEPYLTTVIDRASSTCAVKEVENETLRFAFFATAGSFSPRVTSNEPRPLFNEREVHLESTYTAPKTMPDDPVVKIWIVSRDERGGVSYLTRSLLLESE